MLYLKQCENTSFSCLKMVFKYGTNQFCKYFIKRKIYIKSLIYYIRNETGLKVQAKMSQMASTLKNLELTGLLHLAFNSKFPPPPDI